ncbi:hypothetical protein Pcinc_026751 [Petrolisthes cinctipes]|uniref:Uncharacterized protein n=1 Tax=Petrolisthes cinctipes TaxID=88211 RepID=A0AAE1KB76_PETCI|nr:hypothetical protein Pcinc_026751 [Petrolisthes cinctipes]
MSLRSFESLYEASNPFTKLRIPLRSFKSLYEASNPFTNLRIPLRSFESLYEVSNPFTKPRIFYQIIKFYSRFVRSSGSSKRGLDLGLGRGFTGSQAAKHLMGLAAANFAGGPGRKRRSSPDEASNHPNEALTKFNEALTHPNEALTHPNEALTQKMA